MFGILDVNGWHNVVHILTGVLACWPTVPGYTCARSYAMGCGVVYLVVRGLGIRVGDGDSILSIIPVNTEDNILHLLLGVSGPGCSTPAARRRRARLRLPTG